jgi:hypothetical protein
VSKQQRYEPGRSAEKFLSWLSFTYRRFGKTRRNSVHLHSSENRPGARNHQRKRLLKKSALYGKVLHFYLLAGGQFGTGFDSAFVPAAGVFTNWKPAEPNNQQLGEDCVTIQEWTPLWPWWNAGCAEVHTCICVGV